MNMINIINEEIKTSIEENPDTLRRDDSYDLRWEDDDAVVFGVARVNNKFYVEKDSMHSTMANNYGIGHTRSSFYYAGRLWLNSKTMSFWDYPKEKEKLFDLIKKLEKELEIKIFNNGWLIEVYENTPERKPILIPIEKYTGEYHNPPQEEFDQDHIVSPLLKKKKIPPYNKYSKYKVTPAEYRFYKEKNVAEEIIKEEINRLINKIIN